MPVFPLVASSSTVSPGTISPLASAPSMRLFAILSFTEEHGSNDSNLSTTFATTSFSLIHNVHIQAVTAYVYTPPDRPNFPNRTHGVAPIRSVMLSAILGRSRMLLMFFAVSLI